MDTLFPEFPNIMNSFNSPHGPKTCSSSRNLIHPGYEPSHKNTNPHPSFNSINPHPPNDSIQQPQPVGPSSASYSPSEANLEGDGLSSSAIFKYITDILMEDLEGKTCMLQDCLALQAAEKPFYDVLGQEYPYRCSADSPPTSCISNQSVESPSDSFNRSSSNGYSAAVPFNWSSDRSGWDLSALQASLTDSPESTLLGPDFSAEIRPSGVIDRGSGDAGVLPLNGSSLTLAQKVNSSSMSSDEEERDPSPKVLGGRKIHQREELDLMEEERSNKQSAPSPGEPEAPPEMFDAVLLCPPERNVSVLRPFSDNVKDGVSRNVQRKGSGGKSSRGKKRGKKGDLVDLWTLLTQCAQAVASSDQRTANELLKQIRQHSSVKGDVNQRLAHYFSIALETRLAGTKTPPYTALASNKTKMVDILKAYQAYVKACPFTRMSYFFANRTIVKQAEKATRLHIIDFGILYGFQWPCLIQQLSERPNGPPKLRITGIELPQPGFRPAERVEETVHRLKKYCERFHVPFEYHVIAKKWETIKYEDLNIDRDEVTVVNCIYRLKNIADDTIAPNSGRDTVLNLINRIKPDLFVHGVVNGTYNAPFFVTRFREALFHFSSLFDMFEASVPRDSEPRLLFEKEIFGRDILNVIACEGWERVERPETYKQWQTRNLRAGYRQLPLDQDILKKVKSKIRSEYDKDFLVDEDGRWLLQGWKGRITNALSVWKPVQE